MHNNSALIVISGFSGSGKGTIVKNLINKYDDYVISISATTRKMREGEIDGVHYFFKSKEEFEQMISNNELIEYASYVNNYYGTPKKYVEDMLHDGKNVILEIEVVGAKKIKELYPDALMIFIVPPSIVTLKDRLIKRGTENDEIIKNRLLQAKFEFSHIKEYEYLIVNDDLTKAVEDINALVKIKNLRTSANQDLIDAIGSELKIL